MNERTGTLVQNKFSEYLFPTIMTSLAMSLAGVIDGAIVGNLLGDEALAIIGISAPIIFCINTIYMLFAIGGMSAAAIARGEMNEKRANQAFTVTIVGGLAVMAVFVLIVQLLMEPISLSLVAGDEDLAQMLSDYLRPIVFTGPALLFSAGLALFLRQDGKPQMSGIIIIVANAVNLVFDYILIEFLNTGIMGAGLSTTLGYVVGGLIIMPYLFSKQRTFRFDLSGLKHLEVPLEIFKTGLPKALVQVSSILRALVLNSIIVTTLGPIGMSVMTVLTNLLMVSNIFVTGTSDALLPIAGSLYGEKDYYGIRKSILSACKVLIFAVIGLVVFFIITPETIGKWFGLTSKESLDVLVPAVRMFALYLPFQAFNTTLQNFYNVSNRKPVALAIPLLDGFAFVCLAAIILTNVDENIIWLCFAISGLATSLTTLIIIKIIQKKEGVKGILLLKEEKFEGASAEFSIEANSKDAVSLSENLITFCLEHKIRPVNANRIGLAVEEMTVNTAKVNSSEKKVPLIDVFLRISKDEIILKFRDNGKPFDPTSAKSEEELAISEIEVLKSMATRIEYIGQVGFNVTLYILRRETE